MDTENIIINISKKRLDKSNASGYNKNTESEQVFVGGTIMSFAGIVLSIFETIIVLFTLWALFHEDFFIAVEDRIFAHFRRKRFKVIKASDFSEKLFDRN